VAAQRHAEVAKTLVPPEAENGTAKPGDGIRLADRELAKMVTDVSEERRRGRDITVGQLLDRWLEHFDSVGRSPTTLREYRASSGARYYRPSEASTFRS